MAPETLFRIAFYTFSTAVLLMVFAGIVLWCRWLFANYYRGSTRNVRNLCGELQPELFTAEAQPFPRWSVFDFFLMFGLMILAGSLMQPVDNAPETINGDEPIATVSRPDAQIFDEARIVDQALVVDDETLNVPPAEDASESTSALTDRVQVHFAANAIALVLTLLYLNLVHQATPAHLSLIPTRDDFRRGLVAAVWILSPVLVINSLASLLIRYEHTVTDLLAQQYSFATFGFLFLSAAVLTPIVEEFQFRLLLQGGLQKFTDPATDDNVTSWQPRHAMPVVITSLLFATMHLGQGAAPIPLFFLSLGLGFLYQRTGRLVPVILVHMILNAATLCVEFCRIGGGLTV